MHWQLIAGALLAAVALVGSNFLAGKKRVLAIITILGLVGLAVSFNDSWNTDDTLDALQNYSQVATLNRLGGTGREMPPSGEFTVLAEDIGFNIVSDLRTTIDSNARNERTTYKVNCDPQNLALIESIIKDYSSYPFGYYYKAVCLQQSGNPEWKNWAQKAISIFKITTSIQNHNPDQDQGENELMHSLATDQPIALQPPATASEQPTIIAREIEAGVPN